MTNKRSGEGEVHRNALYDNLSTLTIEHDVELRRTIQIKIIVFNSSYFTFVDISYSSQKNQNYYFNYKYCVIFLHLHIVLLFLSDNFK